MTILQHKLIDYRILAKACEYYEGLGFQQVEVPWIVHEIYMLFTSPFANVGYAMGLKGDDNAYLVCSAEQGFIRQALLDELKRRKLFYAVSPCFRDEEHDETHSKYFMKLELFTLNTEKRCIELSKQFAEMARLFYTFECDIPDVKIVETDIGFDVMARDLELGSYGVRHIMGGEWCAYGTGVALPRVSLARERQF